MTFRARHYRSAEKKALICQPKVTTKGDNQIQGTPKGSLKGLYVNVPNFLKANTLQDKVSLWIALGACYLVLRSDSIDMVNIVHP